jgi:hypothetical protein
MATEEGGRRGEPVYGEQTVLRLVREEGTPTDARGGRGETGKRKPGFEWMVETIEHDPVELPSAASPRTIEFQQRLVEAKTRRLEIANERAQVALEQEQMELCADTKERALGDQTQREELRQYKRKGAVGYFRSVVLLLALIWAFALAGLSSVGSPLASHFSPQALMRFAAALLHEAETADRTGHPQPLSPRQTG